MKTFLPLLILVAALAGVVVLLPGPDPEAGESGRSDNSGPAIAITNVRLFDGTDVIESATLVFEEGHITAAGAEVDIPPGATSGATIGATIIDAAGQTALPGLIDAHVHTFGEARADALRFGVTTMLDMFTMPSEFERTRGERDALTPTDRADLFSAGYLATAAGGHGTQYGINVPVVEGPGQADDWVQARIDEGSDWIKIVIEDGSTWSSTLPTLDAATVRALVEASHERGVLALAHVSTRADALMALDAGVDGLVHLFADRPVDASFIENVRAAGAFIVPTTTVLAAVHGRPTDAITGTPALAERLSPAQRDGLKQRFPGAELRQGRWPQVLDNINALHAAGVPLLAGSDAPNPGTAHGASMHHELALLVEAGLEPIEALRAATSVSARAFGLDGRGCLKVGCRADIVLVDGNPIESIADTAQLAGVWKNGHAVEIAVEQPVDGNGSETTAAAPAEPLDLLEDRERWMAASDQYSGGQSEAAIIATDDSAPDSLRVEGTLRSGFAFPYAGVMWNSAAIPMQATDHSGHDRLQITIEGEAERYRVMFFSGSQSAQPIWQDVPAGQEVTLHLDEFGTLDRTQLRAIGVFAFEPMGDFEFRIRAARLQ